MIDLLLATTLPFNLNYSYLEEEIKHVEVLSINSEGKELIKRFEGLYLKPYYCPSGKRTIGYGHTGAAARKTIITKAEADSLLDKDLNTYEKVVRDNVTVPLTTSQFSALVSFSFNVGEGAFQRSSLRKYLNKSDYLRASKEFPRWIRGKNKQILKGLIKRRKAEQDLFLSQFSQEKPAI